MIRLALGSVADIAIVPMQDILGLDSRARMNVPGKAEGNWALAIPPRAAHRRRRSRLAELTAVYGRWNGTPPRDLDPHHRADSRRDVRSDRREAGSEAADGLDDRGRSRPERRPSEDGRARGTSAATRQVRRGGVEGREGQVTSRGELARPRRGCRTSDADSRSRPCRT